METDIFKEEAYDLLDDIEETLLDLGKNPADIDLVNRLFRAFHTIKGSGAMFGFKQVSEFTHRVETAIDAVRQGRLAFSEDLVEIILHSRDQILRLIDTADPAVEFAGPESSAIMAQLAALVADGGQPAPPAAPQPTAAAKTPAPQPMAADFVAEISELLESVSTTINELHDAPEDDRLLNKLCRALHTVQGSAAMYEYKPLADFSYQVETAANAVKQGAVKLDATSLPLFTDALNQMRAILQSADPSGVRIKVKSAALIGKLQDWVVNSPKASPPEKATVSKPTPPPAKAARLKILIVEDEFISRFLLEEFLAVYGGNHSAVDGFEAVLAFKTALIEKKPYDLVCLDIMMPGLDGREVAKEFRRLEKELRPARPCKIVMSTAVIDPKVKEEMLAAKLCDAYLTKPLHLEELADLIDTFFNHTD